MRYATITARHPRKVSYIVREGTIMGRSIIIQEVAVKACFRIASVRSFYLQRAIYQSSRKEPTHRRGGFNYFIVNALIFLRWR
jgi:hypothetical protein